MGAGLDISEDVGSTPFPPESQPMKPEAGRLAVAKATNATKATASQNGVLPYIGLGSRPIQSCRLLVG
ncbi:hypothetical protein Shell_0687 [Staphylothermus hellenicus DSM 12710]|uniref:Uncharacterized protein n=1 Tax=Staphylothermus hellenicus (strain DSM 12710 / JCM 10830 / BK20S6-10-b1 / P8) TaxID=591019 RepID=D7DCB2_STAHD|nr:hypothetical protein Shell_0687 [Staphylothermus hellenicus DSM 12710]